MIEFGKADLEKTSLAQECMAVAVLSSLTKASKWIRSKFQIGSSGRSKKLSLTSNTQLTKDALRYRRIENE